MMALAIPLSEIGGDQQVAGVWATTSRQQVTILPRTGRNAPITLGTVRAGRASGQPALQ